MKLIAKTCYYLVSLLLVATVPFGVYYPAEKPEENNGDNTPERGPFDLTDPPTLESGAGMMVIKWMSV